MSFQEAIKSVLNKYADFNGRARRSEYWYWTLAMLIAYVVLLILMQVADTLGLIVFVLFYLGVIVPQLAVTSRRLHDTGRSGWWQLISLIPLVGPILLIVWTVSDSQPGENAYGPSPKELTAGGYGGQGGYGAPPNG